MTPFSRRANHPSLLSLSWMTRPVAGLSSKAVNRLCQPNDKGKGATLFTICLSGRRRILNSPRVTSCWTSGFLVQGLSPLFQGRSFWTNGLAMKFTRRASCCTGSCARPTMLPASKSLGGPERRSPQRIVLMSHIGLDARFHHRWSSAALEGCFDARRAAAIWARGATKLLQQARACCLALGCLLRAGIFPDGWTPNRKNRTSELRCWDTGSASFLLGRKRPSVSSDLAVCAR